MKKKVLFLFLIIISLYFLIEKVISDDDLENKRPLKPENIITNEVEAKSLKKIDVASSNIVTPQDLREERAKYPSGIKVLALHEANLSDQTREKLKKDFDNLHKYRNFNQNKLGNEFKGIKKYRKNIDKDYPLSFVPTENDFLENNFQLTGKYASGAFSQESGFNSYTRLFENSETKQKVELTEMYLNPTNHTMIEVFKESFNKKINGLDLTFQEIPVGNTTVYTVDFANNQKMYSLSTIRVEKREVESLVFSLIEASKNFEN